MKQRAKRFLEEHAANPQPWPPPAAIDWLLVDLGQADWPTIEMPPYAHLDGDFRPDT